jgi:hypothetical protein
MSRGCAVSTEYQKIVAASTPAGYPSGHGRTIEQDFHVMLSIAPVATCSPPFT